MIWKHYKVINNAVQITIISSKMKEHAKAISYTLKLTYFNSIPFLPDLSPYAPFPYS